MAKSRNPLKDLSDLTEMPIVINTNSYSQVFKYKNARFVRFVYLGKIRMGLIV